MSSYAVGEFLGTVSLVILGMYVIIDLLELVIRKKFEEKFIYILIISVAIASDLMIIWNYDVISPLRIDSYQADESDIVLLNGRIIIDYPLYGSVYTPGGLVYSDGHGYSEDTLAITSYMKQNNYDLFISGDNSDFSIITLDGVDDDLVNTKDETILKMLEVKQNDFLTSMQDRGLPVENLKTYIKVINHNKYGVIEFDSEYPYGKTYMYVTCTEHKTIICKVLSYDGSFVVDGVLFPDEIMSRVHIKRSAFNAIKWLLIIVGVLALSIVVCFLIYKYKKRGKCKEETIDNNAESTIVKHKAIPMSPRNNEEVNRKIGMVGPPRICPQCGAEVPSGGRFCKKCGINIEQVERKIDSSIPSIYKPEMASAEITDKGMEQLRSLKKLYDDGILTEEEFTKKKNQILGL